MSSKLVKDIMHRSVAVIAMDENIQDIQQKFSRSHFHHLPVIHEGRLVGIVSDRDVIRELSPFLYSSAELARDVNVLRKHAHQIMTRDVKVISERATLQQAAATLLRLDLSCMPVVSADSKLVGVLSFRDILKRVAGSA